MAGQDRQNSIAGTLVSLAVDNPIKVEVKTDGNHMLRGVISLHLAFEYSTLTLMIPSLYMIDTYMAQRLTVARLLDAK